jgi:Ankyrin repeats (many copies)
MALHWAAEVGHETRVRLLLEWGADANVQDISGSTALHWAAESGHEMTIQPRGACLLPTTDYVRESTTYLSNLLASSTLEKSTASRTLSTPFKTPTSSLNTSISFRMKSNFDPLMTPVVFGDLHVLYNLFQHLISYGVDDSVQQHADELGHWFNERIQRPFLWQSNKPAKSAAKRQPKPTTCRRCNVLFESGNALHRLTHPSHRLQSTHRPLKLTRRLQRKPSLPLLLTFYIS